MLVGDRARANNGHCCQWLPAMLCVPGAADDRRAYTDMTVHNLTASRRRPMVDEMKELKQIDGGAACSKPAGHSQLRGATFRSFRRRREGRPMVARLVVPDRRQAQHLPLLLAQPWSVGVINSVLVVHATLNVFCPRAVPTSQPSDSREDMVLQMMDDGAHCKTASGARPAPSMVKLRGPASPRRAPPGRAARGRRARAAPPATAALSSRRSCGAAARPPCSARPRPASPARAVQSSRRPDATQAGRPAQRLVQAWALRQPPKRRAARTKPPSSGPTGASS